MKEHDKHLGYTTFETLEDAHIASAFQWTRHWNNAARGRPAEVFRVIEGGATTGLPGRIEVGERDAARIVACWNACRGMADPEREIARMREVERAAAVAIKPVLEAVANSNGSDFMDSSWNPDAHVEVTLTISECRALRAAFAAAEGGAA